MLIWPEDTQTFVENEIKNFAELNTEVLGTCNAKLNEIKAQLLVNKRRKIVELNEEDEHKLLVELSRKLINSIKHENVLHTVEKV